MLEEGTYETEDGLRAEVYKVKDGAAVGFIQPRTYHASPCIWYAENGKAATSLLQGDSIKMSQKITVPATELPASRADKPEKGEKYWHLEPTKQTGYGRNVWTGCEIDWCRFNNSMIFRNVDDVKTVAEWLRDTFTNEGGK